MFMRKENRFKKIFLIFLLCFCVLTNETFAKARKPRGIMDNINNGLKYAGNMLGINTAADVANLVAKAFASPTNKLQADRQQQSDKYSSETVDNTNPFGIVNGIFRLMGFDSSQLGAVAINGIIFIAQMIGNALKSRISTTANHPSNSEKQDSAGDPYNEHQPRNQDGRKARDGSPLDWILEHPSDELRKILSNIQDPKLPQYLAESVGAMEAQEGDGDCIKQLVCKSAPIIWGMQKAVTERINRTEPIESTNEERSGRKRESPRISIFFKHLPSMEEFKRHAYNCEDRYEKCQMKNNDV